MDTITQAILIYNLVHIIYTVECELSKHFSPLVWILYHHIGVEKMLIYNLYHDILPTNLASIFMAQHHSS